MLCLIAWDVLFLPMKFCKELDQESPKSSPEGLNCSGDSQDGQRGSGCREEWKAGPEMHGQQC